MSRARTSRVGRAVVLTIVPTLGVLLAWFAGAFDGLSVTRGLLWGGIAYSAGSALLLWQVIHGVNRRLDWYRLWLHLPLSGSLLPAALNVLLAVDGVYLLCLLWTHMSGQKMDDGNVHTLLVIAAAFTAMANFGYRMSFVHALRVRAARRLRLMQHTARRSQMSALKAQLDPHFLANSLNALCHLVDACPRSAMRFADNLVWIYRYVLEKGQQDLVPVDDELEFVDRYFQLILLRFGESISLRIDRSDEVPADAALPPLAMQTLLENAVKHNELSPDAPLDVTITVGPRDVTAVNPVRPRAQPVPTSGVGLTNLAGRVRLLTGVNLRVQHTASFFAVTVPLSGGVSA